MHEFPLLFGSDRRELLAAGCPRSVPWDFVAPHEDQAKRNHDQTLKRLAERGGLGVQEMLAVVRGERWRERTCKDEIAGVAELRRMLDEYAAGAGS